MADISDIVRSAHWPSIEVLEELHLIFSRVEATFEGNHAKAAAQMLADQQRSIHSQLHSVISDKLRNYESERWMNDLAASLVDMRNKISAGAYDEPVSVKSNVPIIYEEDLDVVKSFLAKTSQISKTKGYLSVAIVLVFYVRHSEKVSLDINFNGFNTFSLALQRAFAICEIFYQNRDFGSEAVRRTALLEQQVANVDARTESLDKSLAVRRMHIEELVKKIDDARSNQDSLVDDLSKFPDRISNLEAAMMTQLGLRETDKLWRKEANFATVSFGFSFGLLMTVLIGGPIAIYCFRYEFLAIITSIEAAAATAAGNDQSVLATAVMISRLALIGLPVALIVWAIKLIVRFNTRSMLLMDDARHRVAMLNTFLFLLKQEAATIQDRGALLEALFRRAPGHGPETVEPPNLTDLMKYGKEVGAKSA